MTNNFKIRLESLKKRVRKNTGKSATNDGSGMKIVSDLISGLIVGAVIGYVTDKITGLSPLFLVLFMIIGFFIGFYMFYKDLTKAKPQNKNKK